ncbi:MAG: hypothetical protein G5Z42_07815 [Caldisphaeraceae archaeon]|nr:hypothetical protein [Caldisphaeraceae archaeon]MEB3691331.1 hypothetical protein [Caldisphaeraceae archaeon]MEB3798699.1 hypothetical protein [Caldisphaeraceae archaeon]
MIFGTRFKVNNELYAGIDFRGYINVENNIANISLPEKIEPAIIDDSYLKVFYATLNPRLIYRGDAHGTIEGWKYLESHQIDLSEATAILAINEIATFLAWKFLPAIPAITSISELAYLVNHLREKSAGNLEYYIPKVRRKIGSSKKRGAVGHAIKSMHEDKRLSTSIRPLEESVFSIISELRICREIVDRGYDVEFNPQSSGPDLYLSGRSVKLEVATKLEQVDIQRYKERMNSTYKNSEEHSIKINPRVLFMSLLLLLADKLGKELKQGNMVIIDISSTLEGSMMLALKSFSKGPHNLEFDAAINRALELINRGKKAIILYTRLGRSSASLCIDDENALEFIRHIKERASYLIPLRRKHPYEAIKILSSMFYVDN